MVTTATIIEGISLSEGKVWTLAIDKDRKSLSKGGLGKGTKAGSLVGDTLIELLHSTATFMELEGITTLDGLAAAIDEVRSSG